MLLCALHLAPSFGSWFKSLLNVCFRSVRGNEGNGIQTSNRQQSMWPGSQRHDCTVVNCLKVNSMCCYITSCYFRCWILVMLWYHDVSSNLASWGPGWPWIIFYPGRFPEDFATQVMQALQNQPEWDLWHEHCSMMFHVFSLACRALWNRQTCCPHMSTSLVRLVLTESERHNFAHEIGQSRELCQWPAKRAVPPQRKGWSSWVAPRLQNPALLWHINAHSTFNSPPSSKPAFQEQPRGSWPMTKWPRTAWVNITSMMAVATAASQTFIRHGLECLPIHQIIRLW